MTTFLKGTVLLRGRSGSSMTRRDSRKFHLKTGKLKISQSHLDLEF